MTKTEFLELRAGEQRWILLRVLKYMLVALLPRRMAVNKVRLSLTQFDKHVDSAAQERTDE